MPCIGALSAEARRMCAGLHDYAEKTQLGFAQGGTGAVIKRHGGNILHRRRGAQLTRALGGFDSRRQGQGLAWGQVSCGAWLDGHVGSRKTQEGAQQIRH